MIMYYTKGGVTKQDLEKMPFDEFNLYLEEAKRIQEILSPDEGDGDG